MREQSKIKKLKLEGGLRTKGQFRKRSKPGKPLISIITVVRNDEKYLEQTILSVLNQTYKNIEHIIVDGASTDGTLDIIRRFENRVMYWISEPDRGIYDAMNKGALFATGDYISYLNAGDYLYANDSIENILRLGLDNKGKYPLLIAGRIRVVLNDELLNWVMPISENKMHKYDPHLSATLISSTIYKKVFFNILFRISGDTNFWEAIRQRGLFQAKYVDSILSVFRLGGISNNPKMDYYRYIEREISRYIHLKKFSMLRILKFEIFLIAKKLLIGIFGEKIYYKYILYSIYLFRKWFL